MFAKRLSTIHSQGDILNHYAVNVDGDDDFIDWSTNFDSYIGGNASFTFVMWIKILALGNKQVFATGGTSNNGFDYSISTDGSPTIKLMNKIKTDANFDYIVGDWVQHVFVHDNSGNKAIFYKDGKHSQTHSSFAPTASAVASGNARFGATQAGGGDVQSDIAQIALYSDVLTDVEILQIYGDGGGFDLSTSGHPDNLVGWWKMGDGTEGGSGTTIYDMSSNSNNATLADNAHIIRANLD